MECDRRYRSLIKELPPFEDREFVWSEPIGLCNFFFCQYSILFTVYDMCIHRLSSQVLAFARPTLRERLWLQWMERSIAMAADQTCCSGGLLGE